MLQPIHQRCLQKLVVDDSARAIYHGDPSISTPSLISQLIVNVDKRREQYYILVLNGCGMAGRNCGCVDGTGMHNPVSFACVTSRIG